MADIEKILMNITSTSGSAGEAPARSQFFTEGVKSLHDGALRITYDESELIGLPGHTTAITVCDGGITMAREGLFSSSFEFRAMRPFSGSYMTPEGMVRVDVLPLKARYKGRDGGGTIELTCEMTQDGESYLSEYILDYRNA